MNKLETNIPATKVNDSSKGITITAARYASEDAALIVHYIIAILEYSRWCIPLRAAKEKVEHYKREYAEFERQRIEKENEVNILNLISFIKFLQVILKKKHNRKKRFFFIFNNLKINDMIDVVSLRVCLVLNLYRHD